MSEPIIIINFDSLDKHQATFKRFRNDISTKKHSIGETIGEEGKTVLEYITDVYFDYNKITLDKASFVLCKPTFSEFNELVRNKLSAMRVDFVVDEN